MIATVTRIGKLPRYPMPLFDPDQLVVDEFGKARTWDDEGGCTELIGWQKPYPMFGMELHRYFHEHTLAEGRNTSSVVTSAKHTLRLIGPEVDETKIDRTIQRHYASVRRSEGAMNATIVRELSNVRAVIGHSATEGRILDSQVPKFVLPPVGESRTRWLTRDEYRTLMEQKMPRRVWLFLLIAFGMGIRSKAIEEAEWNRIDWALKTIDFRVPGTIYRNKRRVIAPIGDVLFRYLQEAYATRDPSDPFVIGRGPSTYRRVKDILIGMGINERGVARHVARHTFCSWLVQKGISYAMVGSLVGDKASMVEKVYGHLAPDHTRDAANLALVEYQEAA